MLCGIGTSKGIGIGKVLLIKEQEISVKNYSISSVCEETKRFLSVRDDFVTETKKLYDKLSKKLKEDDNNALVLKNQIYLAKDTMFQGEVISLIETEKMCAEAAVDKACEKLTKLFLSMDNDAMKQRVSDISDINYRMQRMLNGIRDIDLSHLPLNTVIVAKEIHPSMTACLDTDNVVGIVAEKGGETSHASILARALEIPAVLSVKGITKIAKDGENIIIDGAYGEVFLSPSEKTKSIYEKKKKHYLEQLKELKVYINKQTKTADGKGVILAANVGSAKEVSKALREGAEGVGLFRTEFLFMNKNGVPGEEEQFEEYRRAAVMLKGKPLTIRTLDIGGDKDNPYLGLTKETNPFLGYRAVRFCLDRVDVFTPQLRAILRASAFGSIKILIPMVTSVNEVLQVKKLIEGICRDLEKKKIKYDKDIKIGVMIETPAAAVMADCLAKEVDFFSIGTNDLTQYTIAVDRCNENVSYLYSVYNPAVLRLIKHVIETAHKEGVAVAMCGEAAGYDNMIPLLISYGLDEYSVSSSRLLETRKNIAGWTKAEADVVSENVSAMSNEKQVIDYLGNYISEKNRKCKNDNKPVEWS